MDRNSMAQGLAVVLVAVLTGSRVFLSVGPGATAGPTNTTSRVRVVSSFGTTFTDCFRFDRPNRGDLSIDLLSQVLPYRHGPLDTVLSRFKAVSRRGQPLSLMFFGEAFDPLNQLTGEAGNEVGDTLVFSGPSTADAACRPALFGNDPDALGAQPTPAMHPYSLASQ